MFRTILEIHEHYVQARIHWTFLTLLTNVDWLAWYYILKNDRREILKAYFVVKPLCFYKSRELCMSLQFVSCSSLESYPVCLGQHLWTLQGMRNYTEQCSCSVFRTKGAVKSQVQHRQAQPETPWIYYMSESD